MKSPGSLVSIRLIEWLGDLPAIGECLQTATGRRYQVVEANGRKLSCVVLTPDFALESGVKCHPFYWLPRGKRKGGV